MQEIELDANCVHDGCTLKGVATICVTFILSGGDCTLNYYFNAAVCEYHRQSHWGDAQVEKFLDDNWQALCDGFGLGSLPERETAGWSWVPWFQAVEFWRKLQEKQVQNMTTKATIH